MPVIKFANWWGFLAWHSEAFYKPSMQKAPLQNYLFLSVDVCKIWFETPQFDMETGKLKTDIWNKLWVYEIFICWWSLPKMFYADSILFYHSQTWDIYQVQNLKIHFLPVGSQVITCKGVFVRDALESLTTKSKQIRSLSFIFIVKLRWFFNSINLSSSIEKWTITTWLKICRCFLPDASNLFKSGICKS